jgi:hypothetical protein
MTESTTPCKVVKTAAPAPTQGSGGKQGMLMLDLLQPEGLDWGADNPMPNPFESESEAMV